ncbi:hypothetical protein SAMN05660328_101295 [Streptococcus gallolyticus]|uniref:Uncharacterized protein n=1 Tax=Streptococcus gallolyticus TaxID=315405 RepID=A0A1I7FB90_9STRE|nr:hypothetical protein [Streptococcus gallolyticus]SFC04846.1 hypothetical protein SAMN02983012_0443 [Streptococcus gallolyticus]SFU33444.1 hypothetical protein SAMN05660328_101295 [Streptococcus gallolyticus]
MSDDIVELYLATGDFHEAVKQSGLPTHIAHLKLIKYSSVYSKKNSQSHHWHFRTKGDQDFIVAFLERKSGSELDHPFILFIPMQFLTDKNDLHVSPSGRWFNEFQVEAEELQPLLNEYAQLRKEGLF